MNILFNILLVIETWKLSSKWGRDYFWLYNCVGRPLACILRWIIIAEIASTVKQFNIQDENLAHVWGIVL